MKSIQYAAFASMLCLGCSEAPDPDATGNDASTAVPKFTDVLASSGIDFTHVYCDTETGSNYRTNPYDHGSGVNVADVDGDGLDDVYLLNFLGSNGLYRNLGNMRFENVTAKAGVAVDRALSVGAAFADYDQDGDQDLYVTTYRGGNHLFQNRGDGTFEDVTQGAGLEYLGHSNSATWFDYDMDGDIDLYLCNIGKFTTETISHEANYFYVGVDLPFMKLAKAPEVYNAGEADILYSNNGDGTFSNVTDAAGIASNEWNGDAAVADIDLDGDPDLYVSNMFGANHLYINNGDATFTKTTDTALKRTSWGGMGARFFDGNDDAYPDLYVVDMHSDMWGKDPSDPTFVREPTAKYNTPLGYTRKGKRIESPDDTVTTDTLFGNTYFENNGDGTFEERSAQANLENWWPWGMAAGDYDNDGHQDLFVTAGMGYPFFYWPNFLYMNKGGGNFVEVAAQAGIEPPALGEVIAGAEIGGREFTRSSRCVAAGDFDGDGDLDLIVNNFNHEPYLLRNDSKPGNWLQIDLTGTSSNVDAVGARIHVVAGSRSWHRQTANSQGYLTQSSARVHIGLGDVDEVDRIEVFWPGSTEPQVLKTPTINQVVSIAQE